MLRLTDALGGVRSPGVDFFPGRSGEGTMLTDVRCPRQEGDIGASSQDSPNTEGLPLAKERESTSSEGQLRS